QAHPPSPQAPPSAVQVPDAVATQVPPWQTTPQQSPFAAQPPPVAVHLAQAPPLWAVEGVPVPPANRPEQHWPSFLQALPPALPAWRPALRARAGAGTAPRRVRPAASPRATR